MEKQTIYISFDVETDGNDVMCNNMISIGLCGLDKNAEEHFSFHANIKELDIHHPNARCMTEFWGNNPIAWENTQINKQPHHVVMKELSRQFTELSKTFNIKFIAQPACFDWMFFKSYYEHAKEIDPTITFDIGCKCISTVFDIHKQINKLSAQEDKVFREALCEVDSVT